MAGEDGNDTLYGEAGSDLLVGGAGNDVMDGGEITDRIKTSTSNSVSYASSASGINLNLQTGQVQDELGGTDALVNINFITGSIVRRHSHGQLRRDLREL